MTALLCLCLLAADPEPEKKEDGTAHVSGTAIVPAAAASFKGRVLEIQLWKHDPRIADVTVLERAELIEIMCGTLDLLGTVNSGPTLAIDITAGSNLKIDGAIGNAV